MGDNRLRFYQDLHFEYDVHGNVTKRTRGNQKGGNASITTLRWNANHQLVEAITERHGVTQTTHYAYDALGRRVSKADSFGATHFLWDGDLMVHSQRGGREKPFRARARQLRAAGQHPRYRGKPAHLLVSVRTDRRDQFSI
ncbi:hypothetical protein AVKW3434_22275 [Acidovorax sp. SUPP3434]|uniref:hypothetical protein n=1 Tax=Acidovorax sp. SUPP3434 TaxID=2920880 RepID=UPI0023DE69CC|nr:hypothetical protein [Acidovorax sp. SUPP3434]GKT02166.1 hypothetical protein AVKW3434_22275 [Acidovorax sp. SUPP3434]